MQATIDRPRTTRKKKLPTVELPIAVGQDITDGRTFGTVTGHANNGYYVVRTIGGRTEHIQADKAIHVPEPTAAQCGTCWHCGHQFEKCDLPRVTTGHYGREVEYEGRTVETTPNQSTCCAYMRGKSVTTTTHNHDRVTVPFLAGLFICRGCLENHAGFVNTIPGGNYVHPSIRAMDAAHAKRIREIGERVGGFYNPKTYNHPSLRKWDAAVKAGKVKLDLVCRFSLLPGNGKLGKGIGKIGTVTVETMDEVAAEAWKSEFAERERRDQEYRDRRAAEEAAAAKASQLAAQAASVTIGAAA